MSSIRNWEVSQLIDRLVAGLTVENAADRIRILARRLEELAGSAELRFLLSDRGGSLADLHPSGSSTEEEILITGLVEALKRARELSIQDEELSSWLDELRSELANRFRIWLLRSSEFLDANAAIAEILNAIYRRDPTGDDVGLIERVERSETGKEALRTWLEALPEPPREGELREALAAANIPREWVRGWLWTSLLADHSPENWQTAKEILDARFGQRFRESYRHRRPQTEMFWVGPPMSQQELASIAPLEAAQRIAEWRLNPNDYRVSARELARTLEHVVASSPGSWTEDPRAIVETLHHPTYISHYFQGLAKSDSSIVSDRARELIRAIQIASTHPWGTVPLGEDDFDYDPTWDNTDDAGVELIKALSDADADFQDAQDTAWALLERAVHRTERVSGLVSPDRDPYESAINRPCTRALQAVLHFVASEHRTRGTVRRGALELFEWVLHLEGRDGLEFRAILGPRLGFLRHIAAAWVEEHTELLFGDEAPNGLGLETLRAAIRWSQPNRWLLERFPDRIIGFIWEQEDRALDHALIAMLWDVSGFQPGRLIEQLVAHDEEFLSSAGERFARLLRPEDVPDELLERGIEFWELALELGDQVRHFHGFGWWTEVRSIPKERWENLMLRTAEIADGRLDWSSQTAERALKQPMTESGLRIARLLLHGTTEPWERARIGELAIDALSSAPDRLGESEPFRQLRESLLALGFHH